MDDSSLKIPARTSSLFAPIRKSQIDDLEINLKRKASQMSTASQSSTAYIDCAIEYHTAKYHLYSEAAVALRESFENNLVTAEEMKDKVKEMTRKRLKAATSMTNLVANRKGLAEKLNSKEQDQREAYQAAIASSFRMSNITKMQVRDMKAHEHWKKSLDRYQKAMRVRIEPQGKDEQPLKVKETWCPVLQRWSSDPKERVAAHIIPHFMGFENVAWMLGDKGDYAAGWSHIWSLKNGMIMSKCVEERFDKGHLAILPLQTPAGKPQR